MHVMTISIYKRPDCPVCSARGASRLETERGRLTWLCGQDTVNVNPSRLITTSMDTILSKLQDHYKILVKSPIVIVFQYSGDVEVSFFQGGRMLIKNVKDEDTASKVYADVRKKLGLKS
jgi:hypothetical protein